MKIVEPSATIIESDLEQLSVYRRIDRCAAVCYQRPAKPTEEEATEFCAKMMNSGHMATMEMAMIHLMVPFGVACQLLEEKFLLVDFPRSPSSWACVSGSIRAWMEATTNTADTIRRYFLAHTYPLFFPEQDQVVSRLVRFATDDEIPWQHRYVAVCFIISRAMSLQMVRHRPCSFLQESQRYCRYDDAVVFVKPMWAYEYPLAAGFLIDCDRAEQRYQMYRREGLSPQQARDVLPNSTKTELVVYAGLQEWKHIFSLRANSAADPEMRRIMYPLQEQFHERYPEMVESVDGK